ncbi:MAG: nitroreductase family deazaflavin-dependent oxidoreductase [Anaerolineales bacterium]|nr:nitroreductase family deazaflavin-dependent oxidoreductase [Anaerolineales bacterium]
MANTFMSIGNSFMAFILKSPIHGLMSKSVVLLFVTGRKSGKVYSVPVNYQRDGETIWINSLKTRTWWRNLRGGASISMMLEGVRTSGEAQVFEDQEEVLQYLGDYLRRSPSYARYFDIRMDPSGNPDPEDLRRVVEDRVVVRVNLVN